MRHSVDSERTIAALNGPRTRCGRVSTRISVSRSVWIRVVVVRSKADSSESRARAG